MCVPLLVDTSVLLFVSERRLSLLDVLFECEITVCRILIADAVVEELKRLALSKASKRGRNASIALAMLKDVLSEHSNLFSVIEVKNKEGDVDSTLISLAKKEGLILATADKRMKTRAEKNGVTVLFLREASGKLV